MSKITSKSEKKLPAGNDFSSDLPTYSEDAVFVMDLFVIDDVSAIFFFEDSGYEAVYERLIKRVMPNIKEFAVVCLGGKSKVRAKAEISQNRKFGVPYIFIVDKDYDDLVGTVVRHKNLYYFRKYCFENYLIDANALKSIAVETDPKNLSANKVERELCDYGKFYEDLCGKYREITKLFIIARKFRIPDIKSTKMSIDELLEGSSAVWPVPTNEWIQAYKDQLSANCHGRNSWLQDNDCLSGEIDNAFVVSQKIAEINEEDHLSGKHLLWCIVRYVQNTLNIEIENDDKRSIFLRIIDKSKFDELEYLVDQIKNDHPAIFLKF